MLKNLFFFNIFFFFSGLSFFFWFLVFGFWILVFGFWFLVFGFWFLVFFTYAAPMAIDVVTDTDVKMEKESEIMSSKNTPEKGKKRSLTVSDDDNFAQLVSMGFDVDEVSTLKIMNYYIYYVIIFRCE
jgi:hypothetical protein